jgi:hypothetical protein
MQASTLAGHLFKLLGPGVIAPGLFHAFKSPAGNQEFLQPDKSRSTPSPACATAAESEFRAPENSFEIEGVPIPAPAPGRGFPNPQQAGSPPRFKNPSHPPQPDEGTRGFEHTADVPTISPAFALLRNRSSALQRTAAKSRACRSPRQRRGADFQIRNTGFHQNDAAGRESPPARLLRPCFAAVTTSGKGLLEASISRKGRLAGFEEELMPSRI